MKITKKVAILGKLETKFKAPFDDLSYDIWAFNVHVDEAKLKRVTVWFDIHNKSNAYTPNPNATITRKNFPFKECEELVGGQYFNNSASYLIAYAILQGYEEIELYGMRFYTDFEQRKMERQNVREICMFARGRGIKISAPYDSCLLDEYPLYGV